MKHQAGMAVFSLICLFPSLVHGLDREYRTQAAKQIDIEREVAVRQSIIHLNMAEEIESEGNYLRAIEMYENFLLLYESSEYVFFAANKIASIYQKMNELPQAIHAYKKAYLIADNQEKGLEAYLKAGRLYREIGDRDTARSIFNEISEKGAFSRISRMASVELASLNLLLDNNRKEASSQADEKIIPEELPVNPTVDSGTIPEKEVESGKLP